MEKRLIKILFFIICLSSSTFAKPVSIKGVVTNAKDLKYVYLYEFYGNDLIKKDSAKVINTEFTFKSSSSFPRGFYQIKFNDQQFLNLILSDENLIVKADLSRPSQDFKVENSLENKVYNTYKTFTEVNNNQMRALQNEANKIAGLQNTNPQAFQSRMAILQAKYDSLNLNQHNFYKDLYSGHEGLFIAKFLKNITVDSSKTKINFITRNEFNDPELLRGDILISKINIFFQAFVNQNLAAWQEEAKKMINLTHGTKGQELAFLALLNIFSSVDMDLASEIAKEYVKAYPKSKKAKNILASMPKPSPKVGEQAPDITLPDTKGNNISLSSLRGKVVLIDFWASWCGPCRMENPNVVRVFNKYKEKGFTIYSVSLDGDKNKWLQAIEKDHLTWVHVSDLKQWKSAGAELYGVRSIPSTFLIDKDGKIIAKNLRGPQLENELQKVLENN